MLVTAAALRDDQRMRLRRAILVCLISLGVPLHGFAGVQYVDASCPLMHEASGEGMDGVSAPQTADAMKAMDCCPTGKGHVPDSGKPCPAGTSCQSIGPALLSVLPATVRVTVGLPAPPAVMPWFQSHDPPLLWRPPALI